jgi:hypothetical protein
MKRVRVAKGTRSLLSDALAHLAGVAGRPNVTVQVCADVDIDQRPSTRGAVSQQPCK